MLTTAPRLLRRSAGFALDFVAPNRCGACGSRIHSAGLCSACWAKAQFVAAPLCARCGLPFDFDAGPDLWCGACIAHPPSFDRARSALVYGDVSRDLILAFKHGDRLDLTPLAVSWLQSAGRELLADADVVIPVPLHPRRLLRRRYNQSSVIALRLAAANGLGVLVGALRRTRNTPSQGGLGRRARETNVRGAIQVHAAARSLVAARRVLLIDDVLTTGATVNVCAGALLRAGAAHVDVLTLARVV